MSTRAITLNRHILAEETLHPAAAGGRASDGRRRLLDIPPESIHQRVALVIGSAADVSCYEAFVRGDRA